MRYLLGEVITAVMNLQAVITSLTGASFTTALDGAGSY